MMAAEHISFIPVDEETSIRLNKDTSGMYVEGFVRTEPRNWMLPAQYAKVADTIRSMEVRKDDIWIVTFPKCGTTWSQEMIWLLCNNLDYATAKSVKLTDRFPFLEVSSLSSLFTKILTGVDLPLDVSVKDVEKMESPRLIKSHLPLDLLPVQLWTVKPKIIYVAREAKDVIVSYFHHQQLMIGYQADLRTFIDSFINNEAMYGPFWPHVIDFWKMRNEENVLFYTYEAMQKDLPSIVRITARFLNKDITENEIEELCQHLNFKNMKQNPSVNYEHFSETLKKENICKDSNANFMRKGKSGSWKEQMNEELATKIDQWASEQLDGTDYDPNKDFIISKQ